jgi:hypothetical protein
VESISLKFNEISRLLLFNNNKVIYPAKRYAGAKEERRYSPYSFLTWALDEERGQRPSPAALYPGKGPPVPTR